MKKIYYLIAGLIVAWGIVSCDNEPKNPGDFTVKSTMSIIDIVSQTSGDVYNLSVAKSVDTVFRKGTQVWDTIWDANGEFVDRKPDTVWNYSNFTTQFIEMQPVILPAKADTFNINISTNAKWNAPTPVTNDLPWIYNDAAISGGGDGTVVFRTTRNRNFSRLESDYMTMYIYTSDSTVFYKIPFGQYGEQDAQ